MDIKLSCSCGAVEGVALNITPRNGNRVVCCCDDCQSFAGYLRREADVLDEFGGTEIFQTTQSQVRIDKGTGYLRCMRLTPKGLIRWYADCCKTPVGNTMNAGLPFVGIIHPFMAIDGDRSDTLGSVRAYAQTRHARGAPTYPRSSKGFPIGISLRIAYKMLVWKIRGLNTPSAFFDKNGKPIVRPDIPA